MKQKIRIISSDNLQNWYADKIGQEFVFHSHCKRDKNKLVVRTTIEQSGWQHGWVEKTDCEFVNNKCDSCLYEFNKEYDYKCPCCGEDVPEVESLYLNIFINEKAEKGFRDKARKYNEGVRKC